VGGGGAGGWFLKKIGERTWLDQLQFGNYMIFLAFDLT
jgi:hypothetical protein